MAYTALSELTASMGSAYELVIKPSYELDIQNNQVKMQVSYGVRKVGANSTTYNIDAGHMWASFGGVAVLGANGTHIDWDQRKDSVGTYRQYASYTGVVQCNNDGTSSIYLYAKFNVGNVSAAKNAEISRTITLPRVPRASTISATPTFIGQATIITIQRASSTFRHTIQYSYSVFWDTIGPEKRSDTSISWVVPTDFYQRLFGKAVTVTLYCDTYDGDTLIGQTSCEFTATVPEAPNKPDLSNCFVSDINPFTFGLEGEANLIRYRSMVKCTCRALAKNYAYIQSITVNGQEMVQGSDEGYTTGEALISGVDTGTFVFVVTDTRGFTASKTVTYNLVPYEVVTFSYSWSRPSSTGSTVNLTLNGRFYNGSFGLKTNTLTVEVKVKRSDAEAWGTVQGVTTTKSGNTWKGTLTLTGLSYDYSYDVSIQAYDAFGTESTSMAEALFTIPPGTPIFDWGKNDLTVNKRLFCKGSIRVYPGTTSGQMGLFAGEAATTGTSFRLIATAKSSAGADCIYVGNSNNATYYYGGPMYFYFTNNAGGICFQNTSGSYYNCCWINSSNRLYFGSGSLATTIQGNNVQLGTSSYPTYVYGAPLTLYFKNNSGGIYFANSSGVNYNCMWMSSSNQLICGDLGVSAVLRGSSVQLGTVSGPTYIYGSYVYIYVPNSQGGVCVTQVNGSRQNVMWINSNDEVYIGSTVLVTRLNGTRIYSSTNITVSSDRENKKAIGPVSDAYEKLLDKLEPQRFHYKDEPDDAPFHVGYIAQDVLAALEDVGLDRTDLAAVAGEEGDLGIAYAELIPLLHKKVKTLEARVEQLEGLVEKLLKARGCDAE